MSKHRPGTYLAKVVDYGITKTKAGLPQAVICFRYQDPTDSTTKDILWWGSFKDNMVERTVDTLIGLGLKTSLETLAEGLSSQALDLNKTMEIVVEERPDAKGEIRAGVAWVNDPNRSRIGEKVSKEEAGQLLSGVNAVLMRKKMLNGSDTSSDLPF